MKPVLPADIQQIFFDTLLGEKSVADFEQWLYADERLETLLPVEDYLELISYGYKGGPVVKYELYFMLEKLIDKGAFEKYRLLKMLYRALKRDEKLPEILISTYDLTYKGYKFLHHLGTRYGLDVDFPYSYGADTWDELNDSQKQSLLNSFGPGLDEEIKKVIYWLENGLVVPTGEKDQYDHFIYIDKRSDE